MAEKAQAIKYTIPSYVQKLFEIFSKNQKKKFVSSEGEGKIEIGETISRASFFYEKIRNAIDYKEEHLLKKNAINRILKRRFKTGIDTENVPEPLIKELIQAGYFSNKVIPEKKIDEIQKIIDKYAGLINQIYHIHAKKERKQIFDWLVKICACEIEENLSFASSERALIDFMFHTLNDRIVIKGAKIEEKEKEIQIYISILRVLVRYDADMISYNILRHRFSNWHNLSEKEINTVASKIFKIKKEINEQMQSRLGDRLNKVIRKHKAIFNIFRDLIKQDPDKAFELLKSPYELEEKIEEVCNEKYVKIKDKLKRTSIRSIIYIFITKILIAVILEVPYEIYYLQESINYRTLAVNVIFHPILLLIIALFIRVPTDENTKKIYEGIKNIVYNYEGKNIVYYVKKPVKRNFVFNFIFNLLYLTTFVFTFGGIILTLYFLHFNIVGMILFVLFLSLVTFFGLKVRQGSRELLVLDRKENILTALVNFIFFPIIKAGHWISVNFAKINIFVFFFDVIIEAPFKVLIDVFEDWSAYIKEKREEIYDRE